MNMPTADNKQVSVYGASHLRPNLPFGQTSDTCHPLSEILTALIWRKIKL